jgi:hypothetical protein
MLKAPLSEIFFCVLRGLIPRRTTLKFEYLREFEPEFENVLGYELGAYIGSIHEKNQGPKISCYCTFKKDTTNPQSILKDLGHVVLTESHHTGM